MSSPLKGWVLLKRGGKISENVPEEKYRPLPMPKEGIGIVVEVELKIEDGKRNIIQRFHNITVIICCLKTL